MICYKGLLGKGEAPGEVKMSVFRLRIVSVEIYKAIHKLNSEFMNNIFEVKGNKRLVKKQYKLNLQTLKLNQFTFEQNL